MAIVLLTAASASTAADWKVEKGDHFIVHYKTNEAFAKQVRFAADRAYGRISGELGLERASDFWSWDSRVKIYIYADIDSFRAGTGQPEWSRGVASFSDHTISTFAGADGFLEGILPHEMTHLIFRDFVGFKGEVPLWLDEGVAQWEEPAKRVYARQVAAYLVKENKAYSLAELTTMDIRGSKDEQAVHHFYMQSVSVVDFLVRTYGARTFTQFCRELRDGRTLAAALKAAYPETLSDLEKLEKAWGKYALSN